MLAPHRRPLSLGRIALGLLVALAALTVAQACNIPVFRYALERWRPDASQLIVYHRGPLSASNQAQLEQLQQRATAAGANVQLAVVDVADTTATQGPPEMQTARELWQDLASQATLPQLPHVIVRLPHPRRALTAWQGSLDQALQSALVDSPIRRELAQRLLRGDSVVWLLVTSSDDERNRPVKKLLDEQCQALGGRIALPEGIGLPGSELYSDVPLLVQFSVLEIDRHDPQEQFLLQVFEHLQPEAFASDEPLAVPVFGRGRALEVIPAAVVTPQLVADLTIFLCGACSCQVKEQNPGFDLLLSADWDRRLFGEGGLLPPPPRSVGEGDRSEPVLLTIPPGR